MDILARCVRCFNYSIRDFCFNNILLFHSPHAAGCSQSYHAKILAGAGNTCNLLLSFMSHGEHIISQFSALRYLPNNFWMCFWDLSSIYEKLRPGCLGSGFFYPHLHQDSHAGCSFWLVRELKFEVPWNNFFFFFVNAPCYFRFSLEQNLSLASRAGRSGTVVFVQASCKICKDFVEIDDKVRKYYFCLLKYKCKRQSLVVWKNASIYMTK